MMLPEAFSLQRIVSKFMTNILKCFSNFSVFVVLFVKFNFYSTMRGPIEFRVSRNNIYIDIICHCCFVFLNVY